MRPWTRETRLLVVTIVLSVSVLLALARLRFPGAEPPARLSLPARPLQPFADRAVFDDLGAAVARVGALVRPALRVVTLEEGEAVAGTTLAEWLAAPRRPVSHAVAIHVGGGRFVALQAPAAHIATSPELTLVGRDPLRALVVLTGAPGAATLTSSRPSLPAFVVVAEATAAGVSVRPWFGSSAEGLRDPRWSDPVIPLGAGAPAPGALVFSLEGAFVGGIAEGVEGRVLVSADALLAAADHVDGARDPRSLGVRVQPLDEGLRVALGAAEGAVVVSVEADGPARGRLAPGDVITAIEGTPVRGVEDALLRAALAPPDAPLAIAIVRQHTPLQVQIERSADPVQGVAPTSGTLAGLGATLVTTARGCRVAAVDPRGAAARAGLRVGDQLWWMQGVTRTTASAVVAAWNALPPGGRLALGITRGEPLLVTIAKP